MSRVSSPMCGFLSGDPHAFYDWCVMNAGCSAPSAPPVKPAPPDPDTGLNVTVCLIVCVSYSNSDTNVTTWSFGAGAAIGVSAGPYSATSNVKDSHWAINGSAGAGIVSFGDSQDLDNTGHTGSVGLGVGLRYGIAVMYTPSDQDFAVQPDNSPYDPSEDPPPW